MLNNDEKSGCCFSVAIISGYVLIVAGNVYSGVMMFMQTKDDVMDGGDGVFMFFFMWLFDMMSTVLIIVAIFKLSKLIS